MTKYIAPVTSILVLIVALMSFALSYHALQGVALSNGLTGALSYTWPLLIDFSLIVFSLCIVSAHVHSESTWRQWSLVGLCTISTIFYNTLYAWPELLPALPQRILVTGVPPIMLFFSFELLMSNFKNSIKRQSVTQVLTDKVEQLTQEVDSPITYRRSLVASMLESGRTQKSIATELDVSISTVRSDIKSMNGVGR